MDKKKTYDITIENNIIQSIRRSDNTNKSSEYVYPSFHDSHLHLRLFTDTFSQIIFDPKDDQDTVFKKISEYLKNKKKGDFIYGGGFARRFLDEFTDKTELDKITPNNPVMFYSRDIHTFLINSKALSLIDKRKKEKFSKYIQKDKNKNETGLIFEKGETLLGEHIITTHDDFLKNLPKAVKKLNSYGITSVHDMDGVSKNFLEGLSLDTITFSRKSTDELNSGDGIKIFLDGSLGSLTAWMDDGRGISNYTENEIEALLKSCSKKKLIPAIHAIGNRSNRILVQLFKKYSEKGWRIEHAQTISDEILPFLKGINFAMQPQHLLFDIPIAQRELKDILHELFRFRSILDNGGNLLFGSDCPVIYPDVIEGIYAASERIDPVSNKVWHGQEKITRLEALNAYTHNCSIYENNNNGVIREGYLADLVVLDRNILTCSPKQLKDTKVLRTYYHGRCVFDISSVQ